MKVVMSAVAVLAADLLFMLTKIAFPGLPVMCPPVISDEGGLRVCDATVPTGTTTLGVVV